MVFVFVNVVVVMIHLTLAAIVVIVNIAIPNALIVKFVKYGFVNIAIMRLK